MTDDLHPDVKALLPLKPLVFDILLVLMERDLHGYGLVKEIEARTGKHRKILPGALYRKLDRMERDGLVEESDWRPDPGLDDERRRYFRITDRGVAAAAAEARRLEALVEESRAKELLAARKAGS